MKEVMVKVRKWPDMVLWLTAVVLSVGLCLLLYMINMLPQAVLICFAVVILLVDLICLVLILRRRRNGFGRWVMRLFLLLLSGALAFSDYTLYNTYSTLQAITSPVETVVRTDLLVRADSKITSLSDLSEKTVGYSTNMETAAAGSALAELGADADGVEYVQESDYASLYEQMLDGKLDAILIPHVRITMLSQQYPDLEKDTVVLHTFETRRTSSVSSSSLDISKEPFVVYIGGIDSTEDPNEYGRCDVNILVMVDPVNNHMTTVSIPRDSYVPNPALGNGSDKLTHLGNDGPENSMEGLEEALGIDIDYYAKVNFNSLIEIVDALGGITVDVKLDFTEQDENRSFKKSDVITLEKGVQTLNGREALAYARHRKTAGYGTTGRENAQQQIISAIMKKLTTAEGIARINDLMVVAQEYVATDIPFGAIQQFVSKQLEQVKPWTVDSLTLKGGVDATLTTVSMPSMPLSCYLLSPSDLSKVFNAYALMFDKSVMRNFSFDLEEDPDCTIAYSVKQEISDYMITSADSGLLSPYTVYYGLGRSDSSRAQAAQDTVQYYNLPVVQPYVPVVDTPVVDTPVADAPVVDTPVVDVPVVDTPVVDTPVVDGPVPEGQADVSLSE